MSEKMREILFRGKTKHGKWVHGWFCGKTLNHMMDGTEECSQIIHSDTLYWHVVKTQTVGQYTGLTDKNGQKIFEGDIISGLGNTYVCKWDEGNVEFTVFDGKESFGLAYAAYPCMEVVGNIHDNPELLKEENDG